MPGATPTRFVYLGPEGTFAEQALREITTTRAGTAEPAASVPEALDAVRRGDADAAVVPLENSIGGAIGVTLDELANGDPLMIIQEIVLPVTFVLASKSHISAATVASVAAHPQAAIQCRGWLRAHAPGATVVEVLSNGAAAQGAAQEAFDAAICAPVGADRHRLIVLAPDIADHRGAVTRFALVARPAPPPAPTGDDVTTIAVYISHDRVGALLGVLTELAVRGVNLTRIESRPTGERLGRYVFFLDCVGHVAEARMGEALQGLHRVCADVRFLGSYPRAGGTATVADRAAAQAGSEQSHASDADYAESASWLAEVRAGVLR